MDTVRSTKHACGTAPKIDNTPKIDEKDLYCYENADEIFEDIEMEKTLKRLSVFG